MKIFTLIVICIIFITSCNNDITTYSPVRNASLTIPDTVNVQEPFTFKVKFLNELCCDNFSRINYTIIDTTIKVIAIGEHTIGKDWLTFGTMAEDSTEITMKLKDSGDYLIFVNNQPIDTVICL